jgi:hypothetical protein
MKERKNERKKEKDIKIERKGERRKIKQIHRKLLPM